MFLQTQMMQKNPLKKLIAQHGKQRNDEEK